MKKTTKKVNKVEDIEKVEEKVEPVIVPTPIEDEHPNLIARRLARLNKNK